MHGTGPSPRVFIVAFLVRHMALSATRELTWGAVQGGLALTTSGSAAFATDLASSVVGKFADRLETERTDGEKDGGAVLLLVAPSLGLEIGREDLPVHLEQLEEEFLLERGRTDVHADAAHVLRVVGNLILAPADAVHRVIARERTVKENHHGCFIIDFVDL